MFKHSEPERVLDASFLEESGNLVLAAGGGSDDDGRWARVKQRLRVELGEDIFSSWFARMDLNAMEIGAVRLSVPTRFLKSWIMAHYAERVLACWRAEDPTIQRIDIEVRSAVIRSVVAKPKCAVGPVVAPEGRAPVIENTASPAPSPAGSGGPGG